jgi:hypothetical protein
MHTQQRNYEGLDPDSSMWSGIILKAFGEKEMRVPDVALRCVLYIGEATAKGTFKPRGTGFIVAVDHRTPLALYLVTADHVVRTLINQQNFAIRLNNANGQAQVFRSPTALEWWRHPSDASVDAAIYPWNLDNYPSVAFPTSRFVTDERLQFRGVSDPGLGIGDETYVVGLFRAMAGRGIITPIVRHGHVAMMATEPISTKKYGDAYLHLIETFSTAGLSGSPVFINETVYLPYPGLPRNRPQGSPFAVASALGPAHCLGLLHGFMPLETMVELAGTNPKEKWHSGISMVVPSQKILEIIDQPKLIEWEKEVDHAAEKYKPSETALSESDKTERSGPKRKIREVKIPPISRKKVFDDLRKATQRKE